MRRHLLPRLAWCDWSGAGLRDDDGDPQGKILVVQWLGVVVEIACGRIRR